MRKLSTFILILLLCSMWVAILNIGMVKAEPKTIIVPDDFSTIQEAIDSGSKGDTIFVKRGIYYNQSLIVNKTLSLIGEDANTTILRGLDITSTSLGPITIAIQIDANNVTITGFTITNTYTGITGNGNGTKISGNIIMAITNGMSIGGYYKTITYNNITGSLHGIHFSGSFTTIIGNNIIPRTEGIDVSGSSNIVSWNNIIGAQGHGVSVNGDSNTISNNNIKDDSTGIWLSTGSNNIVSGNNITENWSKGIWIYQSSNNRIYENYVANNVKNYSGYGVSLSGLNYIAENNTFYRNTFINNSYNFRIEAPYFVNYWDNGEIGNYWDNYSGVDNNGDGIGDTSYILDENNQDNYPLMEPIIIPEFPSWTPLLIMLVVVMAVAVIYRRILSKPNEGRKVQ
jgi:nitrous oxidase accessory protein